MSDRPLALPISPARPMRRPLRLKTDRKCCAPIKRAIVRVRSRLRTALPPRRGSRDCGGNRYQRPLPRAPTSELALGGHSDRSYGPGWCPARPALNGGPACACSALRTSADSAHSVLPPPRICSGGAAPRPRPGGRGMTRVAARVAVRRGADKSPVPESPDPLAAEPK
jgi:hypothetical protein